MSKLIIFIMLILCSTSVLAWKADTHKALMGDICNSIEECKACYANATVAAVIPDAQFKDFTNHHNYYTCVDMNQSWCELGSNCEDCSQGAVMTDDPANAHIAKYLAMANNATGCDRYYYIGIASHYFFDSKVAFHMTKGEKDECHTGLEQSVNDRVVSKDSTDWTECVCGKCVYYSDIPRWEKEFMEVIDEPPIIAEAKPSIQTVTNPIQAFIDAIMNMLKSIFGGLLLK